MTRYLFGRLGQFLLTIFGALIIVFLALHIVADPARAMLPVGTEEAALESFREMHGLNDSLLRQLWRFLTGALRLDFGDSIWLGGDAFAQAFARVPPTLLLAVPSTVIGVGLGVWFGVVSSRRPDGALSQSLHVVSYAVLSLAEFWVALMAILIFAVYLGWLPSGGYEPFPAVMIMPVAVLALRPLAQTMQLTRATMVAESGKQYVLTACAKGLTEAQVSRRHVLRNAAIPIVTLGFYQLSRVLIGTAVIIEVAFSWPGLGRLAVAGLERGDIFLVEAIVVIGALATGFFNLTADLLYFGLDPRTRSLVKDARA